MVLLPTAPAIRAMEVITLTTWTSSVETALTELMTVPVVFVEQGGMEDLKKRGNPKIKHVQSVHPGTFKAVRHHQRVLLAQKDGIRMAMNSNIVSNAIQESIKNTRRKRIASSAKQTPLPKILLVSPSASRVTAVTQQ